MKMKMEELINRFNYRAQWSEEDQVFVAFAVEMPSIQAHAVLPEDAIKEVKTPILAALKWMKEEGKELPMPLALQDFKGTITVRTSPEKHREIAIAANEQGISMNQYVLSKMG